MKQIIAISMAFGMLALSYTPTVAQQEDSDNDLDCSKVNEHSSQMERNGCAELRFETADKALNEAYAKAMEEAKAADAEIAATDPNLVGAVEALKKAERGWIAYRDGYCEGEAFGYRGGSAEYEVLMNCKIDLSEKRTKQLVSPGNY